MSFFAGYGFGRQDRQSAPAAEQGTAGNPESSAHGHGGANAQESSNEKASLVTIAEWKTDHALAGEDTTIRIHIKDKDGNPVDKFDIEHEKLLHLIVVSKDMSYFNHIHPEYKGKGEFVITNSFPSGGEYKVIADYVPTGGTKTTQMEWITVEGTGKAPVALQPDPSHSKVVDGVEVELLNNHPEAGKEFALNFKLTDAATKQPITDLEPYLGAVGHVVILSQDTEQYLHVHPVEEKAKGPDAQFVTSFPDKGLYKIWGQFQRNGKVFTVPFVVEVK
ncbi:hypothetical protein N6H14_21310 [Paenibacillus sp. CC-CFT747]|nr:hypothetical protein N6H14_21310 [Paenibacillus sp. CC-CFT747]